MSKQYLLLLGAAFSLLTGCMISHETAQPAPLFSHQAGQTDGVQPTQPTNYIYGASNAKGDNEIQGANDD